MNISIEFLDCCRGIILNVLKECLHENKADFVKIILTRFDFRQIDISHENILYDDMDSIIKGGNECLLLLMVKYAIYHIDDNHLFDILGDANYDYMHNMVKLEIDRRKFDPESQ